MRHLNKNAKLGRTSDHRMAMLRNMATSFLVEGRIRTSLPKAKALRPIVEKMITLGKKGSLHARRQALSFLYKKEAVQATFEKLAERFKSRPGGYTRIIKLGQRPGDGMKMCHLELVDYQDYEGRVKKEALEKKAEKKALEANKAGA